MGGILFYLQLMKVRKKYLNEAHRNYTESCLKAVKEMSKRSLSREEMKAQCDKIAEASRGKKNEI